MHAAVDGILPGHCEFERPAHCGFGGGKLATLRDFGRQAVERLRGAIQRTHQSLASLRPGSINIAALDSGNSPVLRQNFQ